MFKIFDKIEKNKQNNRKIVNLFKRKNKNINKFNIENFKFIVEMKKFNENKQILQNEMRILRLNFTTTFIFHNVIKFKIDNVKFVNRNIKLQNEMNILKIKTSLIFNFKLFIDKKIKMSK